MTDKNDVTIATNAVVNKGFVGGSINAFNRAAPDEGAHPMRTSNFDSMLKDTVTLIKPDGRRFENIKASVQTKIYIHDINLPIEEGDVILRERPGGITERYKVTDTGFYQHDRPGEGHFQLTVQKETNISTQQAGATGNVFNFHGANSRVNFNSQDSSVNTVGSVDNSVFAEIRDAIKAGILDEASRTKIQNAVDEMEGAVGKPTFVERYKDFMAVASDHITVFAPFLTALALMLQPH